MSHQFADSHIGLPRRVWSAPLPIFACDLLPCWLCSTATTDSHPVLHGAWDSMIKGTPSGDKIEVFRLVCGHQTSGWLDTNRWSLPIPDLTNLRLIALPKE